MKKKVQKSKTLTQIADELEEEPDNIQSLYKCIQSNIDLPAEDIYKLYLKSNKTKD